MLGGKNSPSGRCMMPGGKVKREGLLKRGMSVKRASVLMMAEAREGDQSLLHCNPSCLCSSSLML